MTRPIRKPPRWRAGWKRDAFMRCPVSLVMRSGALDAEQRQRVADDLARRREQGEARSRQLGSSTRKRSAA